MSGTVAEEETGNETGFTGKGVQMKDSGTPSFRDRLFSWKMFPFWMFAAALVLSLSIAFWTRIPMPDMNRYCPMADAFRMGDWENAFHPRILPLVPVLGGMIEFLTGLNAFSSLKVVSSLSFALSIFPLYGIFRRFLEPVPTRIALLMTAFASMSLRYSSSGLRDSTKGLLYILCVYFLVRIFEEKRPVRNFLYLGVSAGLLALTRTECPVYAVLFLAAAFGLELFRGKAVLPWRTLLSGVTVLLVLLPWLCYMNQTVGCPVPQARYAVYLEKMLQAVFPSDPPKPEGDGKKSLAQPVSPAEAEEKVSAAGPMFTPSETLLSRPLRFSPPPEEEEEEEDGSEELIRFLKGFLKGFYPPFAILAVLGIFLRIRKRQWTGEETVVLSLLLLHFLLLVLQIRIADHCFYISRRYLLPVAPLEFGWSAFGAYAIYSALYIHLKWVRHPAFPTVLLVVSGLLLYLHGGSRILKSYTSKSKSLEREVLLQISNKIRDDYKGPSRFRRGSTDLENYRTNLRPTVYSEWEQLGILSGGQSLFADDPDWQSGRIQPDYILLREQEFSEEFQNAAGYREIFSCIIQEVPFHLYRNTKEIE